MIFSRISTLAVASVGLLMLSFSPASTYGLSVAERNTLYADYKDQGYQVLESRQFSGYSIRMKQPKLCESGGKQYSGYIDKHDTNDHFYFYFVESSNNPHEDPTVLWMNGGPGCSSMFVGNWMNIGPCKINEHGNGTVQNPYSWNKAANVIFLDQPVKTGYSYGDTNIRTTEEAASDVYAFLQIFFSHFKQYASGPFHITTFSYGGHFGPAVSREIVRRNQEISSNVKQQKHLNNGRGHGQNGEIGHLTESIHINFQSLMLGNGWTNAAVQFREFETFGCTADPLAKKENVGLYRPFLNETTCNKMKESYKHCKSLIETCHQTASANATTNKDCVSALSYCQGEIGGVINLTGKNSNDIRKKCVGDPDYCYFEYTDSEAFANLPAVKAALGIDDGVVDRFKVCSDTVDTNFILSGDYLNEHSTDIAKVLDSGIPVLVYVGDMDWIGNWVANLAYLSEMDWHGKKQFANAPFKRWYTTAKTEAGRVKTAKNLTFLKVYDAGHMVPFDQPKNSLNFFTKWIGNRRL